MIFEVLGSTVVDGRQRVKIKTTNGDGWVSMVSNAGHTLFEEHNEELDSEDDDE